MSNVTTIGCTREYLIRRAGKHRRAGRYDEAMALLWKAKDQFGLHEDIELEAARVYTEMGCEEAAARAYLRVMRLNGAHKGDAMFELALGCAQRGDLKRAVSYYEQYMDCSERSEVSADMAAALGRQLLEELEAPPVHSRRAYARRLERKAAARLQEGKARAAQHLMEHAVRLNETAHGYTLLACCYLVRNAYAEAVQAASHANRLSPGRIQTLCVLSDAYAALGEEVMSRRALCLAAMRTGVTDDDLFSVALESAKHGEDRMTLRVTKKLLARDAYHTPGMRLRACALMNLGRRKEASRLFGRLCGLLPEDTVCAYYYRLALEETQPAERLTLGADVTREEGIRRAAELIAQLYMSPEEIAKSPASLKRICRLCAWAFRSLMVGGSTRMVALILMMALGEKPEAQEVLLDVLTDPDIAENFKMQVLQALTARNGFQPYCVDVDGKLAYLAAGGISTQQACGGHARAQAVQRASDALAGDHKDAPQVLMDLYLQYLERYPQPKGREEDACAAALMALYVLKSGKGADLRSMAANYGITLRRLRMMLRRFRRCAGTEKTEE